MNIYKIENPVMAIKMAIPKPHQHLTLCLYRVNNCKYRDMPYRVNKVTPTARH